MSLTNLNLAGLTALWEWGWGAWGPALALQGLPGQPHRLGTSEAREGTRELGRGQVALTATVDLELANWGRVGIPG